MNLEPNQLYLRVVEKDGHWDVVDQDGRVAVNVMSIGFSEVTEIPSLSADNEIPETADIGELIRRMESGEGRQEVVTEVSIAVNRSSLPPDFDK